MAVSALQKPPIFLASRNKTNMHAPAALHFHLTVASAASASSYEDNEFVYQPLLNQERDRELLDLLPDYLTEEICFPRGQAAKFYCKVVDSMSKKVEIEEEEEDEDVVEMEGVEDGTEVEEVTGLTEQGEE